MRIVGTHDEINYILTKCQRRTSCDDCILKVFCDRDFGKMFKRLNPAQIDAFEHGFQPTLLQKGESDSADETSNLYKNEVNIIEHAT